MGQAQKRPVCVTSEYMKNWLGVQLVGPAVGWARSWLGSQLDGPAGVPFGGVFPWVGCSLGSSLDLYLCT